ncbi:MAG: succinate dehydrogenase assembly factor 2 [Candidatus Pelagibacter sp.]|nr:succinate dehydrogenase assembly factor 2 [Candidatus Pelagibacter sp.]
MLVYISMSLNKEELKNKIIYRASYRGTKEMDLLMIGFVKSVINNNNIEYLKKLNFFINMDDEEIISLKNKEIPKNLIDETLIKVIDDFKKFKL